MVSRPRRVLAAVVAVVVVLAGAGAVPAWAVFTSTITNTGNTVSADTDFSINGALYVWGDNGGWQLTPTQIGTGTTWTSATTGDRLTCGIAGGKLFCLGSNNGSGQQGVNDTAAHYTPLQVGSADWTAVAAGSTHTCGIQSDSTLWCWGANGSGQLAQSTATTSAKVPTQVTSPAATGWATVSAGTQFTCATRTDGSLYCWGTNAQGQLGIGSTTPASSSTPLQVAGSGWTAVALGAQHACGLQGSTLSCWGNGSFNRLGQLNSTSYSSPMTVLGTWAAVTAGADHTCALTLISQLYCWGFGGSGRLGGGTASSTTTGPAPVGTATTWRSISAGAAHTCGTRTDNSLYCWGANNWGQVGDGGVTDQLSPVKIGASVWSAVAPGEIANHTCAIRTDGTLWCWGVTGLPLFLPTRIGTGTTWHQAATGDQFLCAIRDAGALYCFGQQNAGRLGAGDNVNHFLPTPVTTTAGTTFSEVTAGSYHACAVGTDTTMWCWGSASYGQTGQGNNIQQNSPVQIMNPATGWTSVSAGALYTCAVRSDSTMYCWGQNAFGEMGQGVQGTPQTTPVAVTSPAATGWVQVSAGHQHVCALRTDTKIYCWASDGSGRLGLGSGAPPALTPTAVSGTGGYMWVGLGADHSCALKTNGTLWCWGTGWNGRLGNNSTADKYVPTQTTGSSAWRKVNGINPSTCGVRADNSVWCWGSNGRGQLGLGSTFGDQLTPVRLGLTGRPLAAGAASHLMGLIAY
ncbi:chromosome condensation regulator RCC1 [Paractinoplanes abujensis]|uniref:Alpha-tubulin suppressor-like RCC1 family protein n=1 Tax=Paractinoplanes abujensis TaxID=882441 RepID=A0A7W7G4R7_9ACTN|nr:hypothetical protein [Actinoplanes abujensis]MBB4694136.1 alpha-tubulin suppressor-like RCC1 family protein [Actinoplanes abujensis]GID20650.1 chromosome condensation regulator RCC1 [Actinoplanes abujensis]